MSKILVKHLYEAPLPEDGRRFLADRLYSSGISKKKLKIDGRLQEGAPSEQLHRWFAHKPHRWEEFKRGYLAQLETNLHA